MVLTSRGERHTIVRRSTYLSEAMQKQLSMIDAFGAVRAVPRGC